MFERSALPRCLTSLFVVALLTSAAAAQTTTFTYQGKLSQSGSPASGTFDMQFKLFDSPIDGNQIGVTIVNDSVLVTDGIFIVQLDFGAGVFDGTSFFLCIAVRPSGNIDPYTELAPRQPVTSAPYAIQTINAQQLGGLPASRYVATDANGNVGIGTPTPSQIFEVNGTSSLGGPGGVYGFSINNGAFPGPYPSLGFNAFYNASTFSYLAGVTGYGGIFQFQNGDGQFGYYSTNAAFPAGSAHTFIPRFVINKAGNMGIGTTAPSSKLHVVSNSINNNAAIYGRDDSSAGIGVQGFSPNFIGVSGNGANIGVAGDSVGGTGVKGASTSGPGVLGVSGNNYGVYGTSGSGGYAGYFEGRVRITGPLNSPGAFFRIDHPLDPDNKYLIHSSVQSPDMKNLYDGTVTTDENGEAEIALPDWFTALNRDFRYQLTCIGLFAQAIIAEEIKNNRFKIKTSVPQVKVSWQVTGTRQDAWATQNRTSVEELKPAAARGSK